MVAKFCETALHVSEKFVEDELEDIWAWQFISEYWIKTIERAKATDESKIERNQTVMIQSGTKFSLSIQE